MPSFTPTQGRYLSFILAYTEGFDLPPAESEIADALKVSPPSVNQMMKMLEKKGLIRRLNISLRGIKPPIWRCIETLDVTLAKFHEAIQNAMGWTNSHLHAFEIGRTRYTDPRMLDEVFPDSSEKSYARIKISDLINSHGPKLKLNYLYDFGDGWEHDVTLEKTTARVTSVQYPRCLSGKRNCPPEDVGGIYGYEQFLDAIGNTEHEEHDDFVDWAGEFDAVIDQTLVGITAVKQRLQNEVIEIAGITKVGTIASTVFQRIG